MTLTELATSLKTQAGSNDNKIVLDSSILPSATAGRVKTSFVLDGDLMIDGVKESDIPPEPTDGKLVINPKGATTSVLGLTGVPVTLEFTMPASDVEVVIRVTMKPTWIFKDSFSGLDLFPFNQLDFSKAGVPPPQFVYTSAPLPDNQWPEGTGDALPIPEPGLYFYSKLALDHFTLVGEILGNFIHSNPVNLYGPFQPTAGQPLPVTKLRAPLLGSDTFKVGTNDYGLELSAPAVAVWITPAATPQELQEIDLVVESDFQKTLNVALAFPIGGNTIALRTRPVGASASVTQLIQALPGGKPFLTYIPEEVKTVFSEVGLDNFSMVFDTTPKVKSVGFKIGTVEPWPLIKKDNLLVLDNLFLRVVIVDPAGMNLVNVSIEADAEFLPKVFKGRFVFNVELEKNTPNWLVSTVSGQYFGVVKLGDLVSEILGNSAPEALQHIQFSDFGLTATRTAIGDLWTYSFAGEAEASFAVLGTELSALLYVGVVKTGAKNAVHLAGGLVFGEQDFALTLDLGTAGSKLSANWETTGSPFGFNDISQALDLGLPAIPRGLDLGLTSAGLAYDFTNKTIAFDATSANFGKATFAALKVGAPYEYAFQFEVGKTISLSDIPLVGDKLPAELDLAIKDLGLVYASVAFDKTQVEQVNALLGPPLTDVTLFPTEGIAKGFNISATLQLGDESQSLSNGISGGSSTQESGSEGESESSGELAPQGMAVGTPSDTKGSSSTKWISIQKQFGVFDFQRVGIGYTDGVLTFSLDAGMNLGPLTFSMMGLSIGSPIEKFEPKFDIAGLGLSYDKPPLEIEGALFKKPSDQLAADVSFQFDGTAVVKAGSFSLAAIGSYAQLTNGDPSLFVFAQLEAPLGGPPAFFITGLMAGFGFNRSIDTPAQDEVTDFPLLVLGAPPEPGTNAPTHDPATVLQILEGQVPIKPGGQQKEWIKPNSGDYWLAVGLEATSFEIVKSKAVLIVEFGHDLVFTLLGTSTLQLPQPNESSETYAFVELGLKAQLKPNDGFFGLSAVLSDNSYVLTPDCHLTGGFAFYLWFGDNDHTGNFVITLGGYHPAFKPPSYYPSEPRLGFNWAVSSTVSISGGAYFALTPSCVMAGGSLNAQYHDGDLRAWFTAYADVLISWRPFFFTADIGVSIGVSYRLNLLFCHTTIKVSLSASVDLWGPPTGGRVHVHLWVVSFTVYFGSDETGIANKPLDWSGDNGFTNLLPHPKNICRITASDGMYKNLQSPPPDQTNSEKLWVIRARKFRFFTESVVPASDLVYGNSTSNAPTNFSGEPIDIKPMNKTGLASQHKLSVYRKDGESWTLHDIQGWTLTPRKGNLPKSLWGTPPAEFTQIPDTPSADVVPNLYVGYDVTAPQPHIGGTLGLVTMKSLAEEYLSPEGKAPIDAAVKPSPDFVPSVETMSIADIAKIQTSEVSALRNTLYGVLSGADIYSGPNANLDSIGNAADHLYSDAPMVQR